MKKSLGKFLLRCLWVIGVPPLLMLLLYVLVDPFMVLREYDNYFGESGDYPVRPHINKGMVSIKNYNRQQPDMHYNAFILGSSVSVPYRVTQWAKAIAGDSAMASGKIRPIHIDSSSESVHSLRLKLEYLRREGADLRHVLIVAPPMWLEFNDALAPPFVNIPEIDPDVTKFDYHWMYLRSFYNREFFRAYVMAKIMGRAVQVGTVNAIRTIPIDLIPLHNEQDMSLQDDSVRNHTSEFYSWRTDFLIPRVLNRLSPAMTPKKEADLRAIKRILHEEGTDYEVVIGPTLHKQLPAESDLAVLYDIFGSHLHDFSQKFAYMSDIDTCYLDNIHYRCPVAMEIVDSVYSHR